MRKTGGPRTTRKRHGEILAARARLLAKVSGSSIESADSDEALVFLLGDARYAVEIRYVAEVAPYAGVAALPGLPGFISGLMHRHGQMVAVLDLLRVLGLGETPGPRFVVVLKSQAMQFAVAVGDIIGMKRLAAEDLLPPPEILSGSVRGLVRGLTADSLVVMDGIALLAERSLIVDQQ